MKVLLSAAACVCATAALSLAAPLSATAATSTASHQDLTWLKSSIQTDLAEVQGGKLAQTKSTTPSVVKLAQTVVADHSKMLTSANKLAAKYKMTVTTPSHAQQKVASKLSTETGNAFDVSYSQAEVSGHQKAIKLTKREIKKGSNRAIKAAARAALPMLEGHLRLAETSVKTVTPQPGGTNGQTTNPNK